ncbi:MAG: SDR family NAD(P)-dependent oxidoreductase [Planctomycetota bacterium]
MSTSLTGRSALVTGASAGIGRATALDLASRGVRVAVNARRSDKLADLVAEIEAGGGQAQAFAADAAEPEAIDNLWTEVCAWADGVPEIVVANAGRGLAGSVLSSDQEAWESMFKVNVTGAMRLIRLAANAMRDKLAEADDQFPGADIVVLGSVVGTNVSPFSGAYGATKFAVEAAAEALRREVGGVGVRVTTIKPGIVISEFQGVAGYGEQFDQAVAHFGKMLEPEDVARSIGYVLEQPPHVHVNTLTIRPVGMDYP